MSLYKIVESVRAASGSLEKTAILKANSENELLKEFMRCVSSPAINFWQRSVPTHPSSEALSNCLTADTLEGMLYYLADRNITGRQAERWLGDLYAAASKESKALIQCLIDKSIGAGVGDKIVLSVWPNLFFTVPYQRCGLLDDKAKVKFSKLPVKIIQEKCDGSFLYLVNGWQQQGITRAGSCYPVDFVKKLIADVPAATVVVGELLVYKHGKMLPRQTGNGILNSVLKGGEWESYEFKMVAWDCLTLSEFTAGKSNVQYGVRLKRLEWFWNDVVKTQYVKTMEEVYAIYSQYLAQGKEGAVLKNPESLWSNGTSKDMVKMKIVFEAEYKITGWYEGEGKYKGMLGGYNIETSDGLLKCNVGTGFTDAMRKVDAEDMVGKVCTISANDVIDSLSNTTKSLFLPVFVEYREDKPCADSLERVLLQLRAAKG